MAAQPRVHVLVCGNADRCDDGAALLAVGSLLAQPAERWREARFQRCPQLDVTHLLEVPAGRRLVIVDTAIGVRPGRVVTVELDELIDNPRGPAPHSSHALPINLALGVANALSAAPLRGYLVAVGGLEFGFGDHLSPPVRRALKRFSAAIAAAIDQLAPAGAGSADR